VPYGSKGFAIFMVVVLLVMVILYSGQEIHLKYSMGGACGKVMMQMVECGIGIMLWINELIFSMHWFNNGVNEGSLACNME
jgi:hypothetical protein